MSQSFDFQGTAYSWEGDLDEFTELTPNSGGEVVRLESLVAMTNGAVLAALPPSTVRSAQQEAPVDIESAFVAAGIVASGAVIAREGPPNGLAKPERAIARLLGDDGLGRSFDALVASRTVDHVELLATAVERSHQYRGFPAALTAGAARAWARSLPDETAAEILYSEAAEAFERAQSDSVVASARQALRERVHRG